MRFSDALHHASAVASDDRLQLTLWPGGATPNEFPSSSAYLRRMVRAQALRVLVAYRNIIHG